MAEKIYCIKCGREIKDGLLYCDRCGQSVAKSKARQSKSKSKRKQAEQIHREQINRRKRREEKEIKKQAHRRKARRRAAVFGAFLGILVLGVVCASGAYIYMSRSSSIRSVDDVVNEDIAQSSPAATVGHETTGSVSPNAGMNFRMCTFGGLSCPYPDSFKERSVTGDEIIKREDPEGGAIMTISGRAIAAGGAARDMMTAYYDEVFMLGDVTENRSGSDWYIVTYEIDTRVFHRKCVIDSTNGTALRYDFEYDKSSAKAEEYAGCIVSIDENFTSVQDNQ